VANSLIPYTADIFNPVTAWTGAQQPSLQITYPSWMTDAGARGIGNSFTPDYAAPVAEAAAQPAPVVAQSSTPVQAATADVVAPVMSAGVDGLNGSNGPGNAPVGATGSFSGDVKGLVNGLGSAISNAASSASDALGIGSGGGYGADPVSGGGGAGAGSGMGADASMQGAPNAKGGILTRNKLIGPNPPGPDNGFASVESGEGVLTRKALEHYGPGIVGRLNKLMVDKSALR